MNPIIEQVARTLWVYWWSNEVERYLEDDPEHEKPWEGGGDIDEVAPPTPPGAYIDAGRLVGMVEERNKLQIDACWAQALTRDGRDWESLSEHDVEDSKKEFGHCLAMVGLGTGVSWRDDHEDWGLEVPEMEPGHMPEVFTGVLCKECGEDLGPEHDTCDECSGVICWACRIEEVRCPCCREKELER